MNLRIVSRFAICDGSAKVARKLRRKRLEKKPVRQRGDVGCHPARWVNSDARKIHPLSTHERCDNDLGDAGVIGRIVREVFGLPSLALFFIAYQVERRGCRWGV